MLIIEGSDCVGKTTLAKALLKLDYFKDNGYVYQHLSKMPTSFERFAGHKALSARRIVQDRFHMSDTVYRAVEGSKQKFTPESYRALDGWLRGFGSFTVVVVCDSPVLLAERHRAAGRTEMYHIDKVIQANDIYRSYVAENVADLRMAKMDMDYVVRISNHLPDITDAVVEDIAEHYQARQRWLDVHTTAPFWGNLYE